MVSIVGGVLLLPAHSGAEPLGAMRLELVEGDVQVKIVDTGEWAPVSVNMPLLEGDELWVPEGSRAALQTNSGAYVRLGGNTALQVLRMESDSFQFHLLQGRVYALNGAAKQSLLQFDTPDTSLRAFGNSTFGIEVPDGETDVSVYKGSVLAETGAGTTDVQAGSMLALGPNGFAELSPLPPPDDWEEWNAERDRTVLARRESSRYLPDDLAVYSSDFDDNGRWVYVQDYGYCWTPTALVIRDWAPYRHGRWIWRGADYVWVGYEPWGWAPYHYGRWAFVVNIGWCWVPPPRGNVFWGPGYVAWVQTAGYVAWVPLAPRETYYGYGNYGPYSVNVRNVDTRRIRATNVYRNVNVSNSITVVNRTTFLTGRPESVNRNVAVNAREDFAQRRNIVVGRPQIKPVETSYLPVVRSIPETRRPPAEVRKIDVKELRQSRPLVTEPGRSALRPQVQPRPLEVRKVETPRPVSERTRERRQVQPAERRVPGAPQAGPRQPQPAPPVGRQERGGRPTEAAPAEKKMPERPARPEPAVLRGRPQEAPVERVRPEAPQGKEERGIERGRPEGAPAERGRPEQPQVGPDRGGERGGERGPLR